MQPTWHRLLRRANKARVGYVRFVIGYERFVKERGLPLEIRLGNGIVTKALA